MSEIIKYRKIILTCFCILLVTALFTGFGYNELFGAPEKNASMEQFIIAKNQTDIKNVILNLKTRGFIKNSFGFKTVDLLNIGQVQAGGYQLSKSMTVWEVVKILKNEPKLKWIIITEGTRKEEIAEILTETFGWDENTKQKWINTYTAMKYDYTEGVYFPDTYLIPVEETPLEIAERMQAHFETVFAPYAKEALDQNIKWTTALTIASIIQREAGGKEDMPIISAVIWNRLTQNMPLEMDATLQYARGKTEQGWWTKIGPNEKNLVSAYNTYKNKGLPPHPIANPGIDAIYFTLHPATSTCIYYLHDKDRNIHCTDTYTEHQINIEKYLK